MKRLRQLSAPGGAAEGAFRQLLPGNTYLCFCAGLEKKGRIREILRDDPGVFFTSGTGGGSCTRRAMRRGACDGRADHRRGGGGVRGDCEKAYDPERRDLLQEFLDLGWRELLRRFSEAAFTVYRKQYRRLENPPRTAEVEERLGPLPADVRAMAVVANGFRGLWHTFGGGFHGVDKFVRG